MEKQTNRKLKDFLESNQPTSIFYRLETEMEN